MNGKCHSKCSGVSFVKSTDSTDLDIHAHGAFAQFVLLRSDCLSSDIKKYKLNLSPESTQIYNKTTDEWKPCTSEIWTSIRDYCNHHQPGSSDFNQNTLQCPQDDDENECYKNYVMDADFAQKHRKEFKITLKSHVIIMASVVITTINMREWVNHQGHSKTQKKVVKTTRVTKHTPDNNIVTSYYRISIQNSNSMNPLKNSSTPIHHQLALLQLDIPRQNKHYAITCSAHLSLNGNNGSYKEGVFDTNDDTMKDTIITDILDYGRSKTPKEAEKSLERIIERIESLDSNTSSHTSSTNDATQSNTDEYVVLFSDCNCLVQLRSALNEQVREKLSNQKESNHSSAGSRICDTMGSTFKHAGGVWLGTFDFSKAYHKKDAICAIRYE